MERYKSSSNERPIIGISAHFREGNSQIADAYVAAVVKAGGVPLVLPVVSDAVVIAAMVDAIDGLLMSGGGDMDPSLWGEELIPESGVPDLNRDQFDLSLIDLSARSQKPILGICRGMQALNVAFGGSLFQDIYTQRGGELLVHDQIAPKQEPTHEVELLPGSLLMRLMGSAKVYTNTIHHQAVKGVAPGFVANAFSSDGICEGIEHPNYPMLGVQWHPEHLSMAGMAEDERLFDYLIEEALLYKHAKVLHKQMVSVDSHCDTPMVWYDGINLGERQEQTQVDFVKMVQGGVDCAFMVAYIEQKPMSDANSKAAYEDAKQILTNIAQQVKLNSNRVGMAGRPEDVVAIKRSGRVAIVPGIENGYALNGRVECLSEFYDMGVRYITLCHNGDNDVCDSARGNAIHGGLSELGKRVVKEMNRLGMMIDVAHAADSTIDQVIALSQKPVVSSHSSCRALCHSKRNLTDAQIVALAAKGGVCQICLYSGFLREQGEAGVADAVAHVNHIVQLVGEDYVGIGSDFDGGGGILGCQNSEEWINLTKALLCEGYSDDQIKKIMGGNFLRVWKANCE